MQTVRYVAFWLFVCCLPVLLVTTAIRWAVNEVRLYEYGFEKHRVSQDTGISSPELRKVALDLIDYFNFRRDEAQVIINGGDGEIRLFSVKELIHLQDVRGLIQLNTIVQLSALAVMLVCISVLSFLSRHRWANLAKGLFAGSVLTLSAAAVMILWCWLGFRYFFYLFHVVSFSNEYWMLDPAKDYLIRLFPEGFFYDAALFVFGAVLIVTLLVMGVSLYASRLFSRQKAGAGSAFYFWRLA